MRLHTHIGERNYIVSSIVEEAFSHYNWYTAYRAERMNSEIVKHVAHTRTVRASSGSRRNVRAKTILCFLNRLLLYYTCHELLGVSIHITRTSSIEQYIYGRLA